MLAARTTNGRLGQVDRRSKVVGKKRAGGTRRQQNLPSLPSSTFLAVDTHQGRCNGETLTSRGHNDAFTRDTPVSFVSSVSPPRIVERAAKTTV